MSVYIVCSTDEGVDWSVTIEAVYLSRDAALAFAKEANGPMGPRGHHWVWAFEEGHSYVDSVQIYPTAADVAAVPPACNHCGGMLVGETVEVTLVDPLNAGKVLTVHPGTCRDYYYSGKRGPSAVPAGGTT